MFGRIPLPYALAALVVVLLTTGAPGQLLAHLLDTGDPARAAAVFLAPLDRMPAEIFVAQESFTVLIPLYGFLGIRYMRGRIQRFEPRCAELCHGRRDTWARVFRPMAWATPVLVLLAPLLALRIPELAAYIPEAPGPFSVVQALMGTVVFRGAIAGFVWVYVASVKGLYDLGREDLNLRSFYDDSMLGLRPLGALSLQLSYVYFLGVTLGALGVLTSPNPSDLRILGLVLATAILGIVLFFIPLQSVHRRMVEAKQRELSSFRSDLRRLRSPPDPTNEERREVAELRDALTLDMVRAEIAAIPTWPVDTTIMGKLATIVIAVVGLVVAQIVQVQLGIA